MRCLTHWEKLASGVCSICGEPFCSDCLATAGGASFCAQCKPVVAAPVVAVPVATPQVVPLAQSLKCPKANDALLLAVLSWVICGFLAPFALLQARAAERMIAANPGMSGASEAKAARILSIVVLCLYAVGAFFWVLVMAMSLATKQAPGP